ncbi:hypothetical protein HC031_00100 [Planosporangium thailandense]|uniref:NERD domain-containing protein n=1 Tax=Planosporangium thailandense TaxID=765197 RepID=A0ABX0XRZ7_9ACTN|nr:hypothetical protein [Planosporangium thailandense]NJC68127.1 hypothetical protein [Planosporangium thailandense]
MSSGESWTRSAGRPGAGQQIGGGEEQPAPDERERRRARWRDLSPSALRAGPVPRAEELGEDDYWSYLRGDREHPPSGDDADEREDRAAARQPPPAETEAWAAALTQTWSPRVMADGDAEQPETTGDPAPQPQPQPQPQPPPLPGPVVLPEWEPAFEPVAEPASEPVSGPEWEPQADLAREPRTATAREPLPEGDAARVHGQPAGRAPAGFTRRERVLPGLARPLALTAVVALCWLAVVAYGVVRLDLLWGLIALAAGVGALALGLQGRSAVGLAPVLVGAAAWGMTTGGEVPESLSDVVGDLQLIALNALYAVPLLIAYGLTTWLDAVGSARDRVRAAVEGRRWWGSADVPDAEPGIAELEAIPSARFFQLPTGPYPHLVTAGRRVALIRGTVWPPGEYTITEAGEVHRDGRGFAQGSAELRAAITEARRWAERTGSAASAVTGFLVVHPASDRPGDRVDLDRPRTGGVRLVTAAEFMAVAGDYLAAEPYRLDVVLTERLGEHLPIFVAPDPADAPPAGRKPPVGQEPSAS